MLYSVTVACLILILSMNELVLCRPKNTLSRDMAIFFHKNPKKSSEQFLEWIDGKIYMSFRRKIRLYSMKSKRYVQVRDKVVNAKGERNSEYGKLIIESVGFGLIRIKGVHANRYICFNPINAKLRAEKNGENLNCIFHEKVTQKTSTIYYTSLKQKWFMAVKNSGKMRRGKTWSKSNFTATKRNETFEFISRSWT